MKSALKIRGQLRELVLRCEIGRLTSCGSEDFSPLLKAFFEVAYRDQVCTSIVLTWRAPWLCYLCSCFANLGYLSRKIHVGEWRRNWEHASLPKMWKIILWGLQVPLHPSRVYPLRPCRYWQESTESAPLHWSRWHGRRGKQWTYNDATHCCYSLRLAGGRRSGSSKVRFCCYWGGDTQLVSWFHH